ncbi:hypothetical protein LCGC14_2152800 [marine sediment metagenome]|uniref:Uncharacterized protein n=1 Tax=marine sediment metagenome TaxID=412755 RepID=A0A0F9DUY9_9ZZZZ
MAGLIARTFGKLPDEVLRLDNERFEINAWFAEQLLTPASREPDRASTAYGDLDLAPYEG